MEVYINAPPPSSPDKNCTCFKIWPLKASDLVIQLLRKTCYTFIVHVSKTMATSKQLMTLTVFVVSMCVDVLYFQVSLTLTGPDKHPANVVCASTQHRKFKWLQIFALEIRQKEHCRIVEYHSVFPPKHLIQMHCFFPEPDECFWSISFSAQLSTASTSMTMQLRRNHSWTFLLVLACFSRNVTFAVQKIQYRKCRK